MHSQDGLKQQLNRTLKDEGLELIDIAICCDIDIKKLEDWMNSKYLMNVYEQMSLCNFIKGRWMF